MALRTYLHASPELSEVSLNKHEGRSEGTSIKRRGEIKALELNKRYASVKEQRWTDSKLKLLMEFFFRNPSPALPILLSCRSSLWCFRASRNFRNI